ncbi:MAG: peptidoglycan DD-metalloendopeptidase family protein [Thermodesulfobacteriota bacterium]
MVQGINSYSPVSINQGTEVKPLSGAELSKAQEKKQLEKAAGEFESIFIYEMLKTGRKGVMKSDLMGDSKGEEIYTSMLDQEYANIMSEGQGMGLKSTLIKEFEGYVTGQRNSGLTSVGGATDVTDAGAVNPAAVSAYSTTTTERGADFMLPVQGRISSEYGVREDPFGTAKHDFHKGLDIAAPAGTFVFPTMAGTVTFSGVKPGYGNVVEVKHDNGYVSLYAHNKENFVKVGDTITTATKISTVGSTGRATGAHLHFELKVEGYAVNPKDLLDFG